MNVVVSDLPVTIPRLSLFALAQYDPHAIMAEASYLPTDDLRLVASAYYRRWSAYQGRLSKTSEGSNTPARPEFRDTISPRVAVEWNHAMGRTGVAVRGGYAFEPTPSPPARNEAVIDAAGNPIMGTSTPVRYVDSHRHVLSAGFGLSHRLSGEDAMSFQVDLFTSLHVVQERTHDIPSETGTAPMVSRGLIPGAGLVVGATW